jgi:hypothetical protein
MTAHPAIMHNALSDASAFCITEHFMSVGMDSPAARLRIARLRAGYETGKEAAEALGFPVSTYLSHENGSRGITAKKAVTYARKYKVREQWLLYGVGAGPGSEKGDETAEIVNIAERLPPLRRAEALRILRVLAGDQ